MRDPRPAAVVISGVGLASALGAGREATWSAIRAGRSGAAWLEVTGLESGLAGFPVAGIGPEGTSCDSEDPVHRLLDRVVFEAIADARLGPVDPDRAAVFLGLSKGGLRSLARVQDQVRVGSPDPDRLARDWLHAWPGAGAARVAGNLGWRGGAIAPVAACATGLVAVLQAVEQVRSGRCDVALAGAVDASLEPLVLGAFRRMRALARVEPGSDPADAVRPWDRDRTGFLVGEGGAVFVLERADRARARGVAAYAEVAGGALGADAHHETALDPDPATLAGVIGRALRSAGVGPGSVDLVHVHGTATAGNDPLECRAIRRALGPAADRAACAASKPQVGHLLGAAGSAELALTALAVRDGFAPPFRNLRERDPACDLPTTGATGRALPIGVALKLSLGFGGHLAAAVLRRAED